MKFYKINILARSDPIAAIAVMAAGAVVWYATIYACAVGTAHPIVLADEAAYLLPTLFGTGGENYARWGILPQVPNLLYYLIYSMAAGSSIYLHAKALNAAFVIGALPAIYWMGRVFLAPLGSAAFALAVLCSPISSFARYFMPECMFFFGFWWTVWILFATLHRSPLISGLATGAALGMLSLVKPHALMLFIAFCCVSLVRRGPLLRRLLFAIILAIFYFSARALVGGLAGGSWNVPITGSTYAAQLSVLHLDPVSLAWNSLGHVAGLFALAGLPLSAIVLAVLSQRSSPDRRLSDLMLLVLCALGTLLAVTIQYSCSIAVIDPGGQSVNRLRGRYYAYVLPLALLAYLALVRERRVPSVLLSGKALALFGTGTVSAVWLLSRLYEAGIVDYAELSMLARWPYVIPVVIVASAAMAAAPWILNRVHRPDLFRQALPVLWCAAIALATSLALHVGPATGKWIKPKELDLVMQSDPLLRALRGRDDGMIVGTASSALDTYRVMFYLASRSRAVILKPDDVLTRAKVQDDTQWLLMLPGADYAGPGERIFRGPLQLVRMPSRH